MVSSQLAQYLPDSESDPEYAERERNFYHFKRKIEARYPQVCVDCAPKVEAALNQAGYRAKTDYLARALRKTRNANAPTAKRARAALNWVDDVGKIVWMVALLMQLLWHVASVSELVGRPVGIAQGGDEPPEILLPLRYLTKWLPAPEKLRRWSIFASLGSLWWNPQFIHTVRGFTRHINGLKTWYIWQTIILMTRYVFGKLTHLGSKNGRGNDLSMLLTLHTGMAVLMIYMHGVARRSVTKDHTSLFGKVSASTTVASTLTNKSLPGTWHNEPMTHSLAEALNEVLASPHNAENSINANRPTHGTHSLSTNRFGVSRTEQFSQRARSQPPKNTSFFTGKPTSSSLRQSFSHEDKNYNDDPDDNEKSEENRGEEMEWTPTKSPHRAFAPLGGPIRSDAPFGASPTSLDSGPFWYKVPPQPKDPASRIRGLPVTPLVGKNRMGTSMLRDPTEGALSADPTDRRGVGMFSLSSLNESTREGKNEKGRTRNIEGLDIKPPSFFAPERKSDPRNDLVGLLGKGLALGNEENSDDSKEGLENENLSDMESWNGPKIMTMSKKKRNKKEEHHLGIWDPRRYALLETLLLIVALGAWVGVHFSSSASMNEQTGMNRLSLHEKVGFTTMVPLVSEDSGWDGLDDDDTFFVSESHGNIINDDENEKEERQENNSGTETDSTYDNDYNEEEEAESKRQHQEKYFTFAEEAMSLWKMFFGEPSILYGRALTSGIVAFGFCVAGRVSVGCGMLLLLIQRTNTEVRCGSGSTSTSLSQQQQPRQISFTFVLTFAAMLLAGLEVIGFLWIGAKEGDRKSVV